MAHLRFEVWSKRGFAPWGGGRLTSFIQKGKNNLILKLYQIAIFRLSISDDAYNNLKTDKTEEELAKLFPCNFK